MASGLTVTDLRIGLSKRDLRSVSVILFRVQRRTYVGDIVTSIEDLGRALDYQRDVIGSNAVARAIIRRLETLRATQGVSVSIAGTASLSGDAPDVEAHYFFLGGGALSSITDEIEIRDGQLVAIRSDGRADTWRGTDLIHLRIGRPDARRSVYRSLAQLRREHQLAELGSGSDGKPNEKEESYSSRAARVNQAAKAERIVHLAVTGNAADARNVYRMALTQPGADGPLAESIADRITSMHDYWSVDAVLQDVEPDTHASAAAARSVRRRLAVRLDQLFGLCSSSDRDPPGDPPGFWIPVVTPLVLEISDALVPLVDSRQDGGHFLYELIPKMRERISKSMGVNVPGVRARGNSYLRPGTYTIQVDEVPMLTGNVVLGAPVAVLAPPIGWEADQDAELVGVHPLTGERSLCLLKPDTSERHIEEERLTPAQYLVNRVELVIRDNLNRLLGPQDVVGLIGEWGKQQGADLVASTLPNTDSQLRLTWILKALISDGVPITNWQAILEAVQGTGGMMEPLTVLRRAVRARLRDQVPGPWARDKVFRIPAELEAAIVGNRDKYGAVAPGAARYEFQVWLRQKVRLSGPAISLVASSQDARELVAALARSEDRLITTFSEDELTPT
jgi:hypothetical protein